MVDPLGIIAECLGEPAELMRNPANVDYRCPYIDSQCTKANHTSSLPFPVCSVYRRGREPAGQDRRPPVCLCPIRFYEADIARDVIDACWVGPKPENYRLVQEVQMQKFGKVDLVIAEVDDEQGLIKKFLPVELQAVDITGSYYPAYDALINNVTAIDRPDYGFNWANVRKRFISQIITKGYFCNAWGTRIVAAIQEDLFEQFHAHAAVVETSLEQSNIVFMLYQYSRATPNDPWSFKLKRVVPTTHALVMQSILYEQPPNKALFERKILERMRAQVER